MAAHIIVQILVVAYVAIGFQAFWFTRWPFFTVIEPMLLEALASS